jgi:hypothetical protein
MVTIIQGQDKKLDIQISHEVSGKPFNLSNISEIKACFRRTDGNHLLKRLSESDIEIINAPLGELKIILKSTDTAVLKDGIASFEIEFVQDAEEVEIVQFKDSLDIKKRIC